MRFLIALVLLLAFSFSLQAQPLVTPDWVAAKAGDDSVRIIDIGRSAGEYLTSHIPGSVFSDYKKDGWRVERNGVPDVVNAIPVLEALLGRFGITADKHVVLVAPGLSAYDMASATRLYWTMKLLGHEKVSVLDGGLDAYVKRKLALQSGPAKPVRPEVYAAKPALGLEAFLPEIAETKSPLVDARPSDEFLGINKSDKVSKPGTLPGAVNLPLIWMMVDGKRTFRKSEEMRALFAFAKVQPDAPMIVFCNTGHTASLVWFVAHELLENKQARLYDGSLAEWALDNNRQMFSHVKEYRGRNMVD